MATPISLRRDYRAGQNASADDETPDSDDPARDSWRRYAARLRKAPLTPAHEDAFMDGWANFDDDRPEITERYALAAG